jgi:hypothetical protein
MYRTLLHLRRRLSALDFSGHPCRSVVVVGVEAYCHARSPLRDIRRSLNPYIFTAYITLVCSELQDAYSLEAGHRARDPRTPSQVECHDNRSPATAASRERARVAHAGPCAPSPSASLRVHPGCTASPIAVSQTHSRYPVPDAAPDRSISPPLLSASSRPLRLRPSSPTRVAGRAARPPRLAWRPCAGSHATREGAQRGPGAATARSLPSSTRSSCRSHRTSVPPGRPICPVRPLVISRHGVRARCRTMGKAKTAGDRREEGKNEQA